MSLTVFTIAAVHAIPVVMTAIVSRSRGKLTLVAIAMGFLALALGGGRYGVLDLSVVIIAYFFSLRFCEKENRPEQSLITEVAEVSTQARKAWDKGIEQSRQKESPRPAKEVNDLPLDKPIRQVGISVPHATFQANEPSAPSAIRIFDSYSAASDYAKDLALRTGESVRIQRGEGESWYAGRESGGIDLKTAYHQQSHKKQRDLPADSDLDARLVSAEIRDDRGIH